MKRILISVIVVGLLLMIGCASRTLDVKTPPAGFSPSCKVLGNAKGTGGGLLFWDVIPL